MTRLSSDEQPANNSDYNTSDSNTETGCDYKTEYYCCTATTAAAAVSCLSGCISWHILYNPILSLGLFGVGVVTGATSFVLGQDINRRYENSVLSRALFTLWRTQEQVLSETRPDYAALNTRSIGDERPVVPMMR